MVRPERHIPEGTMKKPEQHSSALSEHRLVYKPEHTPLGQNMKELSVHMLEHTSQPELHSLAWPYSTLLPERRTTVSSSTGQFSGA